MNFLRNHWYDAGGVLALILGVWLLLEHGALSAYQSLMWCSLISLLLHQLEEYRVVGTFPGMINTVMYNSRMPERFPLNPQTSLIINVFIGWTLYAAAALAAERAVWLGMAAILVSAGNVVAHVVLFNIRGRTLFNAGMASSVLLLLPVVIWFFVLIARQDLARPIDYIAGIGAGVILNVFGVLKMIDWLADPATPYTFRRAQLLSRSE